MDKSHHDREEADENPEAETGAPGSGWRHRASAAAVRRVAARLDGVIAALQRLRLKLAPADGNEAKSDAADSREGAARATRRRPFPMFLIGLLLLLVGIIAGARFSFSLFAQKIERQGDLIASQAEEVYEYDKDARRAERASERSRDDLKEAQRELEETRANLQQAKSRIAEIEGKVALYGIKRDDVERSATNAGSAAGTQHVQRYRGGRMPNRTCDLGSASASQDLSRCLAQTR